MDCFFTQNLINKGNQNHDFATEFDKYQKEFLDPKRTKHGKIDKKRTKQDRIKYFKNPGKSPLQKYKMWKAVDMLHRYSQQQRAYEENTK